MCHKCVNRRRGVGFGEESRFGSERCRVFVVVGFWGQSVPMEDASLDGDAPSSRNTVPTVPVQDLPVSGLGMPVDGPSSLLDNLAFHDRTVPAISSADAFHRTEPSPAQGAESPLQTSLGGPGSNPGLVPNHPSHLVHRVIAAAKHHPKPCYFFEFKTVKVCGSAVKIWHFLAEFRAVKVCDLSET